MNRVNHSFMTSFLCYAIVSILGILYLLLFPISRPAADVVDVAMAVETEIPSVAPDEEMTSTEADVEENSEVVDKNVMTYHFRANHSLGNLHVRSGPSLFDSIIAKIQPETIGVILELGDDWSYVSVSGITGYVYNAYIELLPDE